MDLKISIYRRTQDLLNDKPCFKESIKDVPTDFGYSNLILAFKSVFGQTCLIEFCII